MQGFPILSVMLAVPAVAAIACLFLTAQGARLLALAATLIDFALGILLWTQFDVGGASGSSSNMRLAYSARSAGRSASMALRCCSSCSACS